MTDSDNLIDSGSITDSKADIAIDNGFSFGPVTRIVGVAFLVLGVAAVLSGGGGYIVGPVILLIAVYSLTSKYGTEISLSNNYIREYSSVAGIKTGKWIPTHALPDITVLKLGKTRGVANIRTGGTSFEVDASVNEVYLLSANHRKRFLVKVCKSKAEAAEFAKDLAQKMKKNFVVFSPPVSEKTKARR